MNPGAHREFMERGIAHYALHGWAPRYGSIAGTVGFVNTDHGRNVGVFYRSTLRDPDGDCIGEVTTLGASYMLAPVRVADLPENVFETIARYTGVPPL